MEQVHGVDDKGAVGSVLAHGVAELLDGLHGEGVEELLPAGHLGRGPVPVDSSGGTMPYLAVSARICCSREGWALSPSMSMAMGRESLCEESMAPF